MVSTSIQKGLLPRGAFASVLASCLASMLLGAVPSHAHPLRTVAPLDGFNGTTPLSGVTIDGSGNLFGTASAAGQGNTPNDAGAVWEIKAGKSAAIDIATFHGSDGKDPIGGVTIDSQGNLYGTTSAGGSNLEGVVWEIKSGTRVIVDMADFTGTNGSGPMAGVTIDSQGNLFGTATYGGHGYAGVVWEIKAGTTALIDVADFSAKSAHNPVGGVTIDGQGNLYGTASEGGVADYGGVWEIKAGTRVIIPIADFTGSNGEFPVAGVTLDDKGNLYSTAYQGGAGYGDVWEIQAGTTSIVDIADFTRALGGNPRAGVVMDSEGNFYGTASAEGTYRLGTVWQIDSETGTLKDIAVFQGSNGARPYGGVSIDRNGILYGTSTAGGEYDDGTVWQIHPQNDD